MKLEIKATASTAGLLWALAVALVGTCNLYGPGYGQAFLDLLASLYPGYEATASWAQVAVGSLYALLDGLIGGAVFALVYNLFASGGKRSS